MLESKYQAHIIKVLKFMFPGSVILKSDPSYLQGIPDLVLLWEGYWACLEVKPSASSHVQPNQDFYVKQLNKMSFAAYIYPDNEEEVLLALQQAFKPPRRARVS